jgi:ABC-type uncharacterized transport system ATPase subunit
VRQQSLGERLKCELAAALLHRPRVLFLDEPTIGLDVPTQRRIRGFIADYNRRSGATVLLTSHYMANVERLCRRVIVLHLGWPTWPRASWSTALPDAGAEEIYAEGPDTFIADTFQPPLQAIEAAGGYRISGTARFASAIHIADWVLCSR